MLCLSKSRSAAHVDTQGYGRVEMKGSFCGGGNRATHIFSACLGALVGATVVNAMLLSKRGGGLPAQCPPDFTDTTPEGKRNFSVPSGCGDTIQVSIKDCTCTEGPCEQRKYSSWFDAVGNASCDQYAATVKHLYEVDYLTPRDLKVRDEIAKLDEENTRNESSSSSKNIKYDFANTSKCVQRQKTATDSESGTQASSRQAHYHAVAKWKYPYGPTQGYHSYVAGDKQNGCWCRRCSARNRPEVHARWYQIDPPGGQHARNNDCRTMDCRYHFLTNSPSIHRGKERTMATNPFAACPASGTWAARNINESTWPSSGTDLLAWPNGTVGGPYVDRLYKLLEVPLVHPPPC